MYSIMAWISFDIFRTLGFNDTKQLKPEQIFKHRDEISAADWVLYPERKRALTPLILKGSEPFYSILRWAPSPRVPYLAL